MNDRDRIRADSSHNDDEFDSTLISYDEAVARGASAEPVCEASEDSEFGQRLKRGIACVQLLERFWPRGRTGQSGAARSGTDPSPETAPLSVPLRIGRFEIVREIGHGGCGIVFLAIDPALRREVALKIPRPGALLTEDMRGRFLREARAAAALNHPNVVSIYEAGEADQICYIAEAYCRGPTLAKWLKDRTGPVPAQWAAQIIGTLADAVQHAHLNGVLHRDLKPSNVLLSFDCKSTSSSTTVEPRSPHVRSTKTNESASPSNTHTASPCTSALESGLRLDQATPLISDFGLCKMAEENLEETRSGVLVGTASYMAPEQASGNAAAIGPATDVYGLGAILYEVLTGRPPFLGDRPLEVLQQVEHTDPLPPHRLRERIPADIETICLKCLEKEPHRRYVSAKDLGDDLRRFLNDEPILARRPTVFERLAKFVRRHQSAVMTGAAAAMVALALTVAILLDRNAHINAQKNEKEQALRAKEVALDQAEASAVAARANAQAAEKQHQLAQHNLKKAREAVDRMLTAVAEEHLRYVPQMEQVRRKLLEDALDFYQQFSRQEGDDFAIRLETALATGRLGSIYNLLGRRDEATEALKHAIDQLEPLAAESKLDSDSCVSLIEFFTQFGWTLPLPERQSEVEELFRRSLAYAERLAAEYPDTVRHRKQLAVQCVYLAYAIRQKNVEESEALCRRAIALCEPDAIYRDELVLAWATLGTLLNLTDRSAEAEQASRQALSICEQSVGDDPGHQHRLAETLFGLGRILATRGSISESESLFRRALPIFQKLVDEFPTVPAYRSSFAAIQIHLARLIRPAGRTDEAKSLYEQAIMVNAKLVADFPSLPDYRVAHWGNSLELGELMFAAGRNEEAEDAFGQALGNSKKLAEQSPSKLEHRRDLAITHIELGRLHAVAGRKPEADEEYRQAVSIADDLERDFGHQTDFRADLARAHNAIAGKFRFAGQYSGAQRFVQFALDKSEKLIQDFPAESSYRALHAQTFYLAALIAAVVGKTEDSETAFLKCIEFGLDTCSVRTHLAEAQLILGRKEDYRKSCANIIERFGDTEDWNNANSVAWFCLLSPDSGSDFEQVLRLAEKAVAGRAWQAPSQRHDCLNTLGVALYRSGRFQESIVQLREAVEAHGKGGSCEDWLFLAMACCKAGQTDEATRWYNQAIQWLDKNRQRLEQHKIYESEILRFQAEAAQVLGQ